MFNPLTDVEHPEIIVGPIKVHVMEHGTGYDLGHSHIYFTGMSGLDIMERLLTGFHLDLFYPQPDDNQESTLTHEKHATATNKRLPFPQ